MTSLFRPPSPEKIKTPALSCIINEDGSSAIFSGLIRGETLLLLTCDFNYWPGEGGFCIHTNIPVYAHTCTHKQRWVISGQLFTVSSHQRGGQRGVSWIIDELGRGSWQIYSTRLTPCLSARVPDFSFPCVTVCDSVRGAERRAASLRRHILATPSERGNERDRGKGEDEAKVEQSAPLVYCGYGVSVHCKKKQTNFILDEIMFTRVCPVWFKHGDRAEEIVFIILETIHWLID